MLKGKGTSVTLVEELVANDVGLCPHGREIQAIWNSKLEECDIPEIFLSRDLDDVVVCTRMQLKVQRTEVRYI
jgi:hypothetical protein